MTLAPCPWLSIREPLPASEPLVHEADLDFERGAVPVDADCHHQQEQTSTNPFPTAVSDNQDVEYWVNLAEGLDDLPNYHFGDAVNETTRMPGGFSSGNLMASLIPDELLPPPSMDATNSPNFSTPGNPDCGVQFSHGASTAPDREGATSSGDTPDLGEAGDPLADVTRRLSSRLGRLQITEDHQARYFGATSSLHILHNGPDALSQPVIRTIKEHGSSAIVQAGLEWPGDERYEDHLIDLFFAWHNPLMNVVDPAAFFCAKKLHQQGQETLLYSPFLVNAM